MRAGVAAVIAGVLMLGAPAGASAQGLLIYRHMLPDPSFAEAIQNVPQPGGEADTLGDYYPSGEYLAGPGDFKARACPRG